MTGTDHTGLAPGTHTYPSIKNKTKDCAIPLHNSYRNTCLERESHFLSPYQGYKSEKNQNNRFPLGKKQQKRLLKGFLLWRAGHCSAFKHTWEHSFCTPCYLCCSSFSHFYPALILFFSLTRLCLFIYSQVLIPWLHLLSQCHWATFLSFHNFYNDITWHLYPEIASSSYRESLKNSFKKAPLSS